MFTAAVDNRTGAEGKYQQAFALSTMHSAEAPRDGTPQSGINPEASRGQARHSIGKVYPDQRKLTDYCLSPDHDDGKHKAQLFRDLLGLTREHTGMLLDALKEAAVSGEAILGHADRYGQRYVVDFELVGPRGRITVRSAWIIRPDETAPRLVTCYIL